MADSITAWMATSVCNTIVAHGPLTNASCVCLSDEMAFQKGSKVQIVRFLGFGLHGQIGADDTVESGKDAKETNARTQKGQELHGNQPSSLWAIVSDRRSWVCVKFSKECVAWFDSVHTRPLLSLRGTIIALRWFRPAASMHAAHLYASEADPSRTGPFAVSGTIGKLAPRMFLEVQSIHLWGSINEAIFWDTNDLQAQLLAESSNGAWTPESVIGSDQRKAFRKWFARMRRETIRKVVRQAKSPEVAKDAGDKHAVQPHTMQSVSDNLSAAKSSIQYSSAPTPSIPAPASSPKRKSRPQDRAEGAQTTVGANGQSFKKQNVAMRRAPSSLQLPSLSLASNEDEFGLVSAVEGIVSHFGEDGSHLESPSVQPPFDFGDIPDLPSGIDDSFAQSISDVGRNSQNPRTAADDDPVIAPRDAHVPTVSHVLPEDDTKLQSQRDRGTSESCHAEPSIREAASKSGSDGASKPEKSLRESQNRSQGDDDREDGDGWDELIVLPDE